MNNADARDGYGVVLVCVCEVSGLASHSHHCGSSKLVSHTADTDKQHTKTRMKIPSSAVWGVGGDGVGGVG